MTANPRKLNLKEKYAQMTRGLGWETTYQPMEAAYDQTGLEGIKIHVISWMD